MRKPECVCVCVCLCVSVCSAAARPQCWCPARARCARVCDCGVSGHMPSTGEGGAVGVGSLWALDDTRSEIGDCNLRVCRYLTACRAGHTATVASAHGRLPQCVCRMPVQRMDSSAVHMHALVRTHTHTRTSCTCHTHSLSHSLSLSLALCNVSVSIAGCPV